MFYWSSFFFFQSRSGHEKLPRKKASEQKRAKKREAKQKRIQYCLRHHVPKTFIQSASIVMSSTGYSLSCLGRFPSPKPCESSNRIAQDEEIHRVFFWSFVMLESAYIFRFSSKLNFRLHMMSLLFSFAARGFRKVDRRCGLRHLRRHTRRTHISVSSS
jgi:hypothetical protein